MSNESERIQQEIDSFNEGLAVIISEQEVLLERRERIDDDLDWLEGDVVLIKENIEDLEYELREIENE